MAVNDMKVWSENVRSQQMKNEFYPRETKSTLFDKGYIALYSGHSRGSTVDITLIKLPAASQQAYRAGMLQKPCYSKERFSDNSVDMGTGFDCLDPASTINSPDISKLASRNRLFLRHTMMRYGFKPYNREWWHFTLKKEPYRKYFNFPVQ